MKKDELWQEYDKRGVRVLNGGLLPHSRITPGNFYAGTAIMLYRFKDGKVEFLFQKRSRFVDRNAEKWDVSAGGHVNYQELILDAARREAKEEIGVDVDIDKLEFAAKYLVGTDRIVYLYFYDCDNTDLEFHFDDNEVEEVRWVKYGDYKKFAEEAPIKENLQKDVIFNIYLEEWQEKILKKYGNL